MTLIACVRAASGSYLQFAVDSMSLVMCIHIVGFISPEVCEGGGLNSVNDIRDCTPKPFRLKITPLPHYLSLFLLAQAFTMQKKSKAPSGRVSSTRASTGAASTAAAAASLGDDALDRDVEEPSSICHAQVDRASDSQPGQLVVF